MADNITLNAGTGGATLATDEISDKHYQLVKLGFGALDSFTIVAGTAGLPVHQQTGATWAVSLASCPLPTGAATEATLASVLSALASVAVTGPLTDTQLRATAVPVSGTFWQATQPVSIASVPSHEVTNAGTFAVQAAQSGAWNIANISGTISLPTGAATETTLSSVLSASNSIRDRLPASLTLDGKLAVGVSESLPSGTASIGQVTANAGTNLNTSALALESGGNLAAIATDAAAIEVLLGTIDSDTSALSGCVGGTEVQVDVVSSALPTGAATAANQTTLIGHVDGVETLLAGGLPAALGAGGGLKIDGSGTALPVSGTFYQATQPISGTVTAELSATDNAVLDDIAAKLATIDADTSTLAAAVSTEVQVDVVGALPAGTNAIGKLAANSGVDIGDVDVTSVAPGTAAANLGKAEDAGHTSGDVGVMALAVRQDAAAALAGTDADYAPLEVDAIGRLHANATEISGSMYDGTTLCTVKRFHACNPSDGDSLIAAVGSKKFRILSFAIMSMSGTITRFWLDDADSAVVLASSTGIAVEEDSGAAAPGFILPHNPHGWFQTATANKALRIQLTAAQTVVVFGTYIEVA